MSSRRGFKGVALTCAAVLLSSAGLVAVSAAPANAWGFANQQIADKARSYALGSKGGQCKPWAANVVNAVLAANGIGARVGGYGSSGGAYYGAYQNGGGSLVGTSDAQPGDLIQSINPSQKNSDFPTTTGLHTAIVVARTATAGTYIVRDSNWTLNETVQEHTWSPASWAAARSAQAFVWRFGISGPPPGSPLGAFDAVGSPGPGRISVAGWAFDPNVPTSPTNIHVYVGGPAGAPGAGGFNVGYTNVSRPDVKGVYPQASGTTGYGAEVAVPNGGSIPVYVYAINVGDGANVLLGSKSVAVADPNPLGSFDEVSSTSPGKITVRGWAFDPNAPSAPTNFHVYVGGPAGSSSAMGFDAGYTNISRSDVVAVYPTAGPKTGFSATVDIAKGGTFPVYVYAINSGPGANRLIGSRTITVAPPPAATSLSMLVPSSATYGSSARVSGALMSGGAGVSGRIVQVLAKSYGATAYALVASTTTSSSGAWSLSVKPSKYTSYYARFTGATMFAASSSPVRSITVKQSVSIALNDATATRTQTVYFSGKVAPTGSGQTVYLQRYASGKWSNVKSMVLSSTSGYKFAWKPTSSVDYSFRVYRPAKAGYAAGYSASKKLTVA